MSCSITCNGFEVQSSTSARIILIKYMVIFLSFYHMNTVTKQRDPDTGQHSLLFQVLGLYRHCTCLANIIAFIQREQLITLQKSVNNRYGFYGSGLKTGVENDIFWSFLIIGSGLGEPCGTSPPPRIPRSTPRPPLTMDQCQRRPIRGLLLYFNLLQNAQK